MKFARAIVPFPASILALASLSLCIAVSMRAGAAEPATDTGTQILKWKDGKKAAFMLGFDDSAPSQLEHVVPELDKRKIVGNFYLVTGNKLYAGLKRRWEAAAKSPYVVVANHTFTHKGVNNAAELDPELAKCNEILYALHPERKQPHLLGFGKPGGVPWQVTPDEVKAALTKHHLVDRPPFAGPPINYKSAEACVAFIDNTLAKGDMGQLVFHGVGGDWLVTPVEWFTAILDKLEAVRDQLWVTDVVSWHQYVTERDSAEIKNVKSEKDAISLELICKVDPTLYDLPLTLSTSVPADWKKCTVSQGKNSVTVTVQHGAAKYDAVAGSGVIALKRAE